MRLNIGAGALSLEGFEDVDVRTVGRHARHGHAGDLSFAHDGSVDVLFAHAVFEHVYPAHQRMVLREWKRVLGPTGVAVCLGIPDFEAVAAEYLAVGPGATGQTFDLFEAYRYTHGHPELAVEAVWPDWDPAKRVNAVPYGYAPQLHKGLFDGNHLSSLLESVGLAASLLRYAYPGESPVINLGFVAGRGCDDTETAERQLFAIPGHDRFVRPETVRWQQSSTSRSDRFADEIERLEQRRPSRPRRIMHRVLRKTRE